jgi:hypothetical protein
LSLSFIESQAPRRDLERPLSSHEASQVRVVFLAGPDSAVALAVGTEPGFHALRPDMWRALHNGGCRLARVAVQRVAPDDLGDGYPSGRQASASILDRSTELNEVWRRVGVTVCPCAGTAILIAMAHANRNATMFFIG